MSPFNRPGHTPIAPSTHPNYFGMDHILNYNIVSLHRQDFLEIQELRDSGDVPETSNPQIPG